IFDCGRSLGRAGAIILCQGSRPAASNGRSICGDDPQGTLAGNYRWVMLSSMELNLSQSLDRMTLKDTGSPGAKSAHEFSMTLPETYRQRFNPAEIAAHAHIAMRRGD